MKTANTPVLKPQNNAHRVLSAGFLVGGGHASVAETTRLRAVVEETQAKLHDLRRRRGTGSASAEPVSEGAAMAFADIADEAEALADMIERRRRAER